MRRLEEFLQAVTAVKLKRDSLGLKVEGDVDVSDPSGALKALKVDRSVKPSPVFAGGSVAIALVASVWLVERAFNVGVFSALAAR